MVVVRLNPRQLELSLVPAFTRGGRWTVAEASRETAMALDAGILDNTHVVAKPLDADHPARRIALAWRRGSPREKEFNLLADALREAE